MAWYSGQDIDFVSANPLGNIQLLAELPPPQKIISHPLNQLFETQIFELHASPLDAFITTPFLGYFWTGNYPRDYHHILEALQRECLHQNFR